MIYVSERATERVMFEAVVKRAGGPKAKQAFSRAINHEMAKANTAVKRKLRDETSMKAGDIAAQLKRRRAQDRRLSAEIVARGGAMPLKYFRVRQNRYGVGAIIWGRAQRYKSAFIAPTLSGHVFHRTSRKRLPIEKLWGPAIPKEMMRRPVIDVFTRNTDHIADRALHELNRIMGG